MSTLAPTTDTLTAPGTPSGRLHASLVLAYGVSCYALGMAGLFALILAALGVLPMTGGPVEIASRPAAIAFNLSMVVVFAVQHLIMARARFKQWWTSIIPPAAERPTFVLLAGGLAGLMVWLWQPLPEIVWEVGTPWLSSLLTGLAIGGWVYMVSASFAIDHFELFGLRQVWRNLRGRSPDRPDFKQRLHYRFDRHPLMTGMLFGLWCQPVMSAGHLLLAGALSTYIVFGVAVEERELIASHGEEYRAYRRRVGSLVPRVPGLRG